MLSLRQYIQRGLIKSLVEDLIEVIGICNQMIGICNDITIRITGNDLLAKQDRKISLLDRAVDPQTGTIRARLEFANPRSILKPGMTCNVRIKTTTNNSILIPTKAITEQMGEYFVFVVGDSNKAIHTKITTGMRIGDKTIIENGLKAGQAIVVDGVQKVRDGAIVKPAVDSVTNTVKS